MDLQDVIQRVQKMEQDFDLLQKLWRENAKVFEKIKDLTKEAVGREDIASIISKITGIPVDKMMEGEKERLLNMEYHQIVIFVMYLELNLNIHFQVYVIKLF